MRATFDLILPVLLPSWRFFETVEASPRIEWAPEGSDRWRAAHPRPEKLTGWTMLARLFFNPAWNEALFLVTCAERFREDGAPTALRHIQERALLAARRVEPGAPLQLRIRFVLGQGPARIEEEIYRAALFG